MSDHRKRHDIPHAAKPAPANEPPLMERRPDGQMRFAKGHVKRGGRKPGVKNRVSRDAKELMDALVQYGLENGKAWLQRVARKSPNRALLALARLAEYRLPKRKAIEQSGPGGGPVVVELVQLTQEQVVPPAQETGGEEDEG